MILSVCVAAMEVRGGLIKCTTDRSTCDRCFMDFGNGIKVRELSVISKNCLVDGSIVRVFEKKEF
jgi:hypothetical protein